MDESNDTTASASVEPVGAEEILQTESEPAPLRDPDNSVSLPSLPSSTGHSKPRSDSKRRKRKRPLILELSVSLRDAHNKRHPWEDDNYDSHQHAYDTPDFTHFSQLTWAFLLCTILSVASAFDAKLQCLQHETNAILELVDDDDIQNAYSVATEHEADKCLQMFYHVVLPAGIATTVGSLLVLLVIVIYNRWASPIPAPTVPPVVVGEYQHFHGRVPDWKFVYRITVALVILISGLLVLQTYLVSEIMLQPRVDETVHFDDDTENSDNPYQSLAAVDRFGQVADNANLYYLTWISEILAIALVYQVFTACFRVCRAARRQQQVAGDCKGCGVPGGHELLPATSWDRGTEQYRYRRLMEDRSRAAWYTSLYRLRFRTGIWTAACISCWLIVASSQYIWSQVVWPYVSVLVHHEKIVASVDTSVSYFSFCQRASNLSDGFISPEICRRTLTSWLCGLIAAFLCATAIALHLVARYNGDRQQAGSSPTRETHPQYYMDQDVMQLLSSRANHSSWRSSSAANLLNQYYSHHHPKRLPLRTELVLAAILSMLLGVNAVLVTGVQGPAATVGNLYYASWFSFLLCVRICLGCVEEFYNVEDEEEDKAVSVTASRMSNTTSQQTGQGYEAPSTAPLGETTDSSTTESAVMSTADKDQVAADTAKQEKTRLSRVRGYFFLSIFSTVCGASANDAALNQIQEPVLEQKYMMWAPCVVAALSYLMFAICLSKQCYMTITRFGVGAGVSILSFGLCLANLVLTMHSEYSWAVNSIGEIEMANLYYFSWASVITAGIQLTSFLKALLGIKKLDYVSAVWIAICKVCFVILGASLHIQNTISSNCEFDEITHGAVTFCSRTVLAITVSLTGMLVGGVVVLGRFLAKLCPSSGWRNVQVHVEVLMSLFLVFLFVAAVALITGIGGPGQSPGDLYYSTWLGFFVSLGILVTSLAELRFEERENDEDSEVKGSQ